VSGYSNVKCAQILSDVEVWAQDCRSQAGFKVLSRDARKNFCNVASFFADMMYGYHFQSPEQWSDDALYNVLTEVYPYNLLVQASYYEIVEPVLAVFIKYLQVRGVISSDRAQVLGNKLRVAAPEMLCRFEKFSNSSSSVKQQREAVFDQLEIDSDNVSSEVREISDNLGESVEHVFVDPVQQFRKPNRNDPCPCGSGEKYKKCCFLKTLDSEKPEDLGFSEVKRLLNESKSSKKPTLNQWEQLYDVAKSIKVLAPWDFMLETDLVTIRLPRQNEPVYCSVMGNGEDHYGIGVYLGYEAINEFYRMLEASPDDKFLSLLGLEQKCLTCYFGDSEEVTAKDRAVLKSLNLRFRGRGEWVYFRAMEPGYSPWYLNFEQANLLIQVLRNFVIACAHLEKLKVDFENGETLLRYYSSERKMWLNQAVKMPPIPYIKRQLIIDNEKLLSEIKKQKRNKDNQKLEFDMLRLPIPIQENKNSRPRVPYFIMLVDKTKEIDLDYHLTNSDTPEMDVLEILIDHISEFGRPLSIHVRDDRAKSYIENFCQKTDIELIEGKGVPIIDKLFETMLKDLLTNVAKQEQNKTE